MSTPTRGRVGQIEYSVDYDAGNPGAATWADVGGELAEEGNEWPDVTENQENLLDGGSVSGGVNLAGQFRGLNPNAAAVTALKGARDALTRVWFRYTNLSGSYRAVYGGARGCRVSGAHHKTFRGGFSHFACMFNAAGEGEDDVQTTDAGASS